MDVNAYEKAVNRLAKWRTVFAGRWLGTRPDTDPECIAVRDVIEKLLLLRVEVNALTALLIEKNVFTLEEFTNQVIVECEYLQGQLETSFPGFKATELGMSIDPAVALKTTKGWRP